MHQYTVKAWSVCGTGPASVSDGGNAGIICPPIQLLTGKTPGTLSNNYSVWVGMRFTVGSNPLGVRALGRIYTNGNTEDHELRLIHAATNAAVASVLWTASGGIDGQIHYATLAAPVIMAADTEYYLASKEISGRDRSLRCNTVVTTTDAASVISPIYSQNGSAWTPYGTTGNSTCGGVDLMYCVSSQQFLPPSEVLASNGAFDDKVRVTWNTVSGAANYQLYRATSADGTMNRECLGAGFDPALIATDTHRYMPRSLTLGQAVFGHYIACSIPGPGACRCHRATRCCRSR